MNLNGGDGDDQLAFVVSIPPEARMPTIATTMDGGAGNDNLDGGGGHDTYTFKAGWGQDVVAFDDDPNLQVTGTYAIKPAQNAPRTWLFEVSPADILTAQFGTGLQIFGGELTIENVNLSTDGGSVTFTVDGLTITNSTISGNSAGSTGGGIDHRAGSVTVRHSTITGNSAPTNGGGIRNYDSGTMATRNSIIARNMAAPGPDVFGRLGSQGYNLIGNPQDMSGWVTSDILHVNPRLGPLQDNGGRVASIHPMFGPATLLLRDADIVICDTGDPQAALTVERLFAPTTVRLVHLPLADHDRIMADLLSLAHATAIAFALALPETDHPVRSTTFQALESLAAAVVRESPDVYYEIQAMNPHSALALERLRAALDRIVAAVTSRDSGGFRTLLDEGQRRTPPSRG